MTGNQHIVLRAVIAIAVLGVVAGCGGMFTAEIIQENETVRVAGVSVYPKRLEIDRGESNNQLQAKVVPANASNQLVVWVSSDPSIATVDAAGAVTGGYTDGVAVLTVQSADGEHTDSALIVVGGDPIGKKGPAGGLIFYEDVDNEQPWSFLEAAPQGWYDGGDDPEMVWSNVDDAAVGTTAQEIGTGQANTSAIVAQEGHTESAAEAAAELAHEHGGVTYDDWFLPSRFELVLMWENIVNEGIGGFHDTHYWSSSESDRFWGIARFMRADISATLYGSKLGNHRVRPVRAF